MGMYKGVLAAGCCQLCVFIPQFSVSLHVLKFYLGVKQCGQHTRASGWLKPVFTSNGGGGGKPWVGGVWDGEVEEKQMQGHQLGRGGQVCNGEVRSRRAAMKSKAALLLMSNLYSTLHGRYFQYINGESFLLKCLSPCFSTNSAGFSSSISDVVASSVASSFRLLNPVQTILG